MNLRRALLIAACLLPCAVAPAAAQFQPAPDAAAGTALCVQEFSKLRDDAAKKAAAIRDGERAQGDGARGLRAVQRVLRRRRAR